jgi:hypothetical protein
MPLPPPTPRSRSNKADVARAAAARDALPIVAANLGPQAQLIFLEHLSQSGDLPIAAAQAGTTASAVRARIRQDPVFAAAVHDAWEDFKDGPLMRAARERAITGVEEGVYYRGEPARDETGKPAKVRKFSDAILLRLLEVLDPRFRPHSVQEVRQPSIGPEALDDLTPAARQALEAFLEQRAKDEDAKAQPAADTDVPGTNP